MLVFFWLLFFFFKQKTAYDMLISDWSSDVCSSDLAIMSGPRGRVRGPLAVWLHRPGLAEPAQALGQYCRYDSSLDPALSELAILTMAALSRAEFEWWAHYPIAIKAGISPSVAESIRRAERPEFSRPEAAVVYEFVQPLVKDRRVPDNTEGCGVG